MKILLVGQADSIFFEHYTKNIKKIRPEIIFDVFSVDGISGKYDLSACNEIYVNIWSNSWIKKIKGIRTIIEPFFTSISLYSFLKKRRKRYDIIHFKWLKSGVILLPNTTKKFTKRILITFWGQEYNTQHILYSNKIYRLILNRFIRKADAFINQSQRIKTYVTQVLGHTENFYYAKYGSSIIKQLDKLQIYKGAKTHSKKAIDIFEDKISISIGYTGKALHQHLKIIEQLFQNQTFNENKEKFHFILPMSNGWYNDYVNKVENLIKQYTQHYIVMYPKKYTDEEIACFRNATDIMLQLAKTDGLSSSIIESFYAGSIIVSGKWLPYEVFRKSGLYFHELDAIDERLPELILNISKDIKNELQKCQQNKTKWDYDSWEKVIPKWIDIYEKVLNNEE